MLDNSILDVNWDDRFSSGANIVSHWSDNGGTNQRFYLYEINGAIFIKPKCSQYVLDMDLNEYPANVAVYGFNEDWTPMKFEIVKKLDGDANNDGNVSIADIVMLEKWLLGSSKELTNWQNVDLYEDGIIDVFDMVMLRRLLIEKGITK